MPEQTKQAVVTATVLPKATAPIMRITATFTDADTGMVLSEETATRRTGKQSGAEGFFFPVKFASAGSDYSGSCWLEDKSSTPLALQLKREEAKLMRKLSKQEDRVAELRARLALENATR